MRLSDEHRELIGRLKPLDIPGTPCLDCDAKVESQQVTHAALCPVALCIDDVTDADREWFEDHPFTDYYLRPVTWGEGAELIALTPRIAEMTGSHQFSVQGRVRVEQVADGVRLRKFDEVWFLVVGRPGAIAEKVPASISQRFSGSAFGVPMVSPQS